MEIKQQQRTAIVLLVKAIFDQLHEVNSLKRAGKSANLSLLLLREMCSILPQLDDDLKEYYFSILPGIAGKGAASKPPVSEEYARLSKPAKEGLLIKLRNDLAA